jgi:homoserine dehydrogenase
MARKALTIGIFGFGCVGQGLYQTLQRSPGVQARIKRICVKDPLKSRSISEDNFTFDPDELLNDPEINVIVELIDDAQAAWEIVRSALERGKAVVTANKKMIAEHFEELLELQALYGLPVLYEGACCASIPVIRNLEEYYDNDFLESIAGIFNGSTNYILDRVMDEGLNFADALALAQAAGFAETDPTLDVAAYDPRYKLAILAAHAFGQWVEPADILRFGIQSLGTPEFRFAKERGWRLRLVAQARKVGDELYAAVLPRFVGPDSPLFGVRNENNGVLIEGAFSQAQFFQGKGAGSLPTGSAVLSDISALGYGYQYEYRKRSLRNAPLSLGDFTIQIYFRYHDPAVLGLLEFEEIEESYRSPDFRYLTGRIRARELQTFLARPEAASVFVAELPESRPELVQKTERIFAHA